MSLTDDQRRVLAHLGIPRTIRGLTAELLRDQHAPFSTDDDPSVVRDMVARRLERLSEQGLVASLGELRDGQAVASALKADGLPKLPKEKAQNIARLFTERPDRYLPGGELYALTQAGLDALTA